MYQKGLFLQNVIAVVWDFDRTLSPHYMQKPLFDAYRVSEERFWEEVNALPGYYARAGIHVQSDTCYLGHLLAYVRAGIMPDLTNARLRELGAGIAFFPGIPELFGRLRAIVQSEPFHEADLRLEHYVVSTGIAELVRGSAVAPELEGIWASEFIETPAAPGGDLSGTPLPGPISHIAGFLDHTTKTRALWEINKGVNKHPDITVNDTIPMEERRVPFTNMIYMADGPSDIPSFSVVHRNGGRACAVYAPESQEQFRQAVQLQESGRVDACGPADYRPGTQTSMWLELQVRAIADRILAERKSHFSSRVSRSPHHLKDNE